MTTDSNDNTTVTPSEPKRNGELSVLHPEEGDIKIIWDPDNEDEVAQARKTFNEWVKDKKHAAYAVSAKGEPLKSKRIYEFDSELEKIILGPAEFVGG